MSYIDLWKEIPEVMRGFNFEEYYRDEQNIIKPALENLEYSNIRFSTGERDSFGPLSRIITCNDREGNTVRFWYG